MEKRYTIDDLPKEERGQTVEINGVKVRYDGAYDFLTGLDRYQWTLLTTYIDVNGCDRKGGSFSHNGLREIGVIL